MLREDSSHTHVGVWPRAGLPVLQAGEGVELRHVRPRRGNPGVPQVQLLETGRQAVHQALQIDAQLRVVCQAPEEVQAQQHQGSHEMLRVGGISDGRIGVEGRGRGVGAVATMEEGEGGRHAMEEECKGRARGQPRAEIIVQYSQDLEVIQARQLVADVCLHGGV